MGEGTSAAGQHERYLLETEVDLVKISATSGSMSIMSLCFSMYFSLRFCIALVAHTANGLPTTVWKMLISHCRGMRWRSCSSGGTAPPPGDH